MDLDDDQASGALGVWMVEYVIYAGEGRWRSLYQCPAWEPRGG